MNRCLSVLGALAVILLTLSPAWARNEVTSTEQDTEAKLHHYLAGL